MPHGGWRLAAGNFKPLKEWLNKKIHRLGSLHASGDELMTAVTGAPLQVGAFGGGGGLLLRHELGGGECLAGLMLGCGVACANAAPDLPGVPAQQVHRALLPEAAVERLRSCAWWWWSWGLAFCRRAHAAGGPLARGSPGRAPGLPTGAAHRRCTAPGVSSIYL